MGDASQNEKGSPVKSNDGNNDLNPREEQVPPAYFSADREAHVVEEEDPEDADDMVISPPLTQPGHSDFTDNAQSNLAFPKPTFSLGLTQEERHLRKTDSFDADESLEETASISLNQEPFPANRKSKRQKVVPRSLVGDYQCDKRFLTRAWEAHVNASIVAR
ncbi:hypothetical protein YC2023_101158 [Brassica napus]